MTKKNILSVIAGLLAIIIISGVFFIFYYPNKVCQLSNRLQNKKSEVSIHQAANNALKYFNHILAKSNISAKITREIDDPKTGLYQVEFEVKGKKISAYISRNGRFVFPQAINLQPKMTQIPKTDQPEVRLFVMAFCPFGNQAEDAIIPVIKLLDQKINFKIDYIVSPNEKGGFNSLHGDQELHQDIREICVQKYQPNKFLDFVKEINQNCSSKNADRCWKKIAKKVGLDKGKITKCQDDEAKNLLNSEIKLTQQEYPVDDSSHFNGVEKTPIAGSPALVINGVLYTGARSSQDYLEAICSAFKNPPKECQSKIKSASKSNTKTTGQCGK